MMNSLETSLYFFVIIMTELSLLFIGISTLVGIALAYVSDEKLRRWLSHKGLLGNIVGAPCLSVCFAGSFTAGKRPAETVLDQWIGGRTSGWKGFGK